MSVNVFAKNTPICIPNKEPKLYTLGQTPSEVYSDIVERGIYLTGGGALLRGLAKRLEEKTTIPCHVAEEPLLSVAKGTGIALKNTKNFSFLINGNIK